MDAKNSFFSIAKIPIIGELIIATAIYLTLSVIFATMGYFQLEEQEKLKVFRLFIFISLCYVFISICGRIYFYIKKR